MKLNFTEYMQKQVTDTAGGSTIENLVETVDQQWSINPDLDLGFVNNLK